MVCRVFSLKQWQNAESNNRIIEWDVVSYYSYLPATFIYKDITLEFTKDTSKHYEQKHLFWYQVAPNKGRVIKMTMGMAILYSPFFLIAHAYASSSDSYKPNGFSVPYEFMLAISDLFYLFVGLFYLRKLLLTFHSESIAAITLIAILFGTNLYYYSSSTLAMTHSYTFALVAIFLYQFIKWYEMPNFKGTIFMGFVCGMIILVRPVNIIILLFPLFYDMNTKLGLVNKIEFVKRSWKLILLFVFMITLVFFPQLLYWKYVTGNWFFYSYMDERFYFNNPHILQGLFSYRKGWLLYTPMILFAILGIILLYKRNKKLFTPILVFFFISIYVVYSWWSWSYGGSFGSRPMIDFYALYALPMAACFEWLFKKSKVVAGFSLTVIIFFISLNLIQSYQCRNGIIHWDHMTKESYWNVFLKTNLTDEERIANDKLLCNPDYQKEMKGEDD
jgi:hypothetical protein